MAEDVYSDFTFTLIEQIKLFSYVCRYCRVNVWRKGEFVYRKLNLWTERKNIMTLRNRLYQKLIQMNPYILTDISILSNQKQMN